jgi:transcriptional regulator GlxA family with amidase domain
MAAEAPRQVMMLAYEQANVLDVVGPIEILTTVGRGTGNPAYEVEVVASKAGPFRTTSGLALKAERAIDEISDEDLRRIDTFIVVGGEGSRKEINNEELIDFITRAAGLVRRVVSVCSGSLLLGKAGLLKGRRATSHWGCCDLLRRVSPETIVHDDAIFVRDGEIWTSAGITTGMDLALALIEEDHGRAAALDVARETVMFMMRPGGQSQFSETLLSQAHDKGRLGGLIGWIRENLDEDLSVPRLAEKAHMTERTLARAFLAETGETPARFVERLRVDHARTALSGTHRLAETIAVRAGFGSMERMRRAFKKHLGVSPSDFRARFGTTVNAWSHKPNDHHRHIDLR